jgi:hypothetical protein
MSAAFGRRHLRIRTLERCCCERRAALCLLWIGARGQRYAFESVKRRGVVLVKFDFRFSIFEFRERAGVQGHMAVTALAGHIVNDPASRAGPSADHPTVLKSAGPGGLGSPSLSAGPPSRRAASRSAPRPANANEFPFCALTSGVPLDSRSRSPSGVRYAAHPRPSKPSPTACVCIEKDSIKRIMRSRAVVPDHQQNGERI